MGLELPAQSVADPTHELTFGLPAWVRDGDCWAPFPGWTSLRFTHCKSEPHADILPALLSEVRQESCAGRMFHLGVRAEEVSCLSGGVTV